MTPLLSVTGPAAALLSRNIDTDVIIRIERIASLRPDQMGDHAFEVLRFDDQGAERADFVLNQPAFRGAPILIGGANFGCGSSREAAVWAIAGMGIRVVIAESLGEIFASNCVQNGLLPITLPAHDVARLAAAAGDGRSVTVDLCTLKIAVQGMDDLPFTVDPQDRAALLTGSDEIDRTLQLAVLITAWQRADRLHRPWAWPDGSSAWVSRARAANHIQSGKGSQ